MNTQLPARDDWHTAKQACEALPWLTERTLKTLVDKKLLRYGKRGPGKTAMRVFKLADIEAVMETFVIEPSS